MKMWMVYGQAENTATNFEAAYFCTRAQAEIRLAEWVKDPTIATPEIRCVEAPDELTKRQIAVWMANHVHPDSFENSVGRRG